MNTFNKLTIGIAAALGVASTAGAVMNTGSPDRFATISDLNAVVARAERPDVQRPETPQKPEKVGRAERVEKPEKPQKPEKVG